VADSIVSARTVRPGGSRRQADQSERPARTRHDPAVAAVRAQAPASRLREEIEAALDDEIPF
jgi:hypothetical protein